MNSTNDANINQIKSLSFTIRHATRLIIKKPIARTKWYIFT